MTDDRREITIEEIANLIEWQFRQFCKEHKTTTMHIINNDETIIELNAQGSLLEELKKYNTHGKEI